MRSGGRLAAAIDLLDLIDGSRRPADLIIRDYFRQRRYAGSGDRRAVGDILYGVLRTRSDLDWRLAQVSLNLDNRLRVILRAMIEGLPVDWDDPYAPTRPDDVDMEMLAAATALQPASAPAHVRAGLPEWMIPAVRESFGEDWEVPVSGALDGRADTDLRVNRLKADREAVLAELADDGIEARPHPLVADGIRLGSPVRLEQHRLHADGVVEIQDAGSQIAGLMLGARPGERIADICAGAGGKTLLIAAAMENRGQLLASDVDGRRLDRLETRAHRAGVGIVATHAVGADQDWPAEWPDSFDRVLIDAPCSGTGTWRRQPEARWRLTPERLTELTRLQGRILDRAAALVRPGGRLLYVTCSFLRAENETVITDFLNRSPQFAVTPWRDAAESAGINPLLRCSDDDRFLRLSPPEHGVDSFFVAALERRFR